MYKCAFGDCFKLEDDAGDVLYVDFGIHIRSMKKKDREARYDQIIQDIPEKSDFLLTHYHADHYVNNLCSNEPPVR